MSDDGWQPHEPVELVSFAEADGVPHELAAPLLERGAPKAMLGLYQAADALTLLESSGGQQLMCFGSFAYAHRACLDPQTGEVISLFERQSEDGGIGRDWMVSLVNSSLKQFIASVGAVLNRYPFEIPQAKGESDDSYLDRTCVELDRAADDLTRALHAIDSRAIADPGRFWLDFIDDVKMGAYSSDADA